MGWLLLGLLILDWIWMFVKLFRGVKKLEVFEQTGERNDADREIRQFLFFLILGIIICAVLIVYAILAKSN